jgi:hypothetical protein
MKPTPYMVLRARAEVRAMLYLFGVFDEREALLPLYRYAVESDLVDEIGEDQVDTIIRMAFGIEL